MQVFVAFQSGVPVSDSFRDLERPDPAHRKDAVLMATISGLEYLDRPSRQDLARFSKLFLPLFEAAQPSTRRMASATLSRLPRVPDDVAEMLINQPIEIAAPFIAHYPRLKESMLARAVARLGAPHARAAARRSDLSPQGIAALQKLEDPSVDGLLVLRGLIPDPAHGLANQSTPPPPSGHQRVADAERRKVETPPLDPSEKLRETLREMARRGPAPSPSLASPSLGRKAHPRQPTAPAPAAQASPAAGTPASEVRLNQLARHAKPDHQSWFATALADAMETSYALSERIMMDLSGTQLATALIGLGAPATLTKAALESFFPHLADPSTRQTRANDLIADLDAPSCAARLSAWQRADRYTSGAPLHVPALAESKPVRQEAKRRAAPQELRRPLSARKTG